MVLKFFPRCFMVEKQFTNSIFSGRGPSEEHPVACNCSLQEDRVRLSHSSRHNPRPPRVRWTRLRNFFFLWEKCLVPLFVCLHLICLFSWHWNSGNGHLRPGLQWSWIQLNSPRLDIRGRGIRLVVSARWQKMVTVLFTGVWGEGLSRPYCKVGFEGIFWMRLSHCWALTFPKKVVHISSRIGT